MSAGTKRCVGRVQDCIDDMCRNSVERGLCGKWVEDDDPDEWGDDGYGYDWDDGDWDSDPHDQRVTLNGRPFDNADADALAADNA